MMMSVLDLFSAAAGGWSLGMHRAGFTTVAACEAVDWRRALYAQNNPGIPIYEDVRGLTASRLLRDLGYLPTFVVGSPPCQDISSANTKGKGVEGERSGLFFEAVRIIGEIRPRWFALENSHNLRTRGADAVLAALEALGYACWTFVVRASDVGANHERPRCWIIGCDLEQVADADGHGRAERWSRGRSGLHLSIPDDHLHTAGVGHEGGRTWGHGQDGHGAAYARDTEEVGCASRPGDVQGARREIDGHEPAVEAAYGGDPDHGRIEPGHLCKHGIRWPHACQPCDDAAWEKHRRETPDPDQARQAHGCMEPGLRQAEIADDGCGDGRGDDGSRIGQMAICPPDRGGAVGSGPLWSLADLAGRVLLDARIQAWTLVAFLLDEGGQECLAEQLILEAKSAGFAERLTLGSDLQAAMRTLLASYSESTVLSLAPIAETLSNDFSITLAPEKSWEALAKSAPASSDLASTTSTKSGRTTIRRTFRRSACPAIPGTISEQELRAVHRRAERRLRQSASRLVEAYGDAVVPQIPEAIGRAILRVEAALSAIYGAAQSDMFGDAA